MTRWSPTSPYRRASLAPTKLLPPLLRQAIWRGRAGSHSVALTFDDGPHPVYTPQILNILRHHRARATFFPLGRNVERYPQIIRQIFAEGHTIGNHSYAHGRLIFVSPQRIRQEMAEASAVLERITGQRPRFFRPPRGLGGLTALRMASLLGMRTVLWTLSPRDWTHPGVGRIVGRVVAKARDGAIILLHDAKYNDPGEDRSQTVQALPNIIRGLRAKGYRLVTLTDLVSPRKSDHRGAPEK